MEAANLNSCFIVTEAGSKMSQIMHTLEETYK